MNFEIQKPSFTIEGTLADIDLSREIFISIEAKDFTGKNNLTICEMYYLPIQIKDILLRNLNKKVRVTLEFVEWLEENTKM